MTDADDAVRELKEAHDLVSNPDDLRSSIWQSAMHARIDRAIEAKYTEGRMVGDREGFRRGINEIKYDEQMVRREENVALKELADTAEAYMKYHTEKFYSDLGVKPTGLWPAIKKARARISKEEG